MISIKKLVILSLCSFITHVGAKDITIIEITESKTGKRVMLNNQKQDVVVTINDDATVQDALKAIRKKLAELGKTNVTSIEDLHGHLILDAQPKNTKVSLIMPYPKLVVAAKV